MNNNIHEELVYWLSSLIVKAKNDEQFKVARFMPTENKKFSIVGGWMSGFSKDFSNFLCISQSNPTQAMCVKIIVNNAEDSDCDFETLSMPMDKSYVVDDTCIALELEDNLEDLADFLLCELDRINEDYEEA